MIRNTDTLLQIAVQLFVIYHMVRLLKENRRSMPAVFFTFALVSFLVSDLYWITHTLMKAGARIPFAANEIGESGMYLLIAAVLNTAFREKKANTRIEVICTALFSAASAALWIGWSGEWVKDILSGIVFGYFLCTAVRSLKITDSFSKKEWVVLAVASAVLIAVQTTIFFVPPPINQRLDAFCYVLMFVGIALFFLKTIRSFHTGKDADQALSLSFASFGWTTSTMYMSADPMWFAADTCCTVVLLLMYFALRRKVFEA